MPNKGYKKLIALLSASAMIASIIPSVAFADDTESLSEVAVVETELEEATAEDIFEVEDNDFGAGEVLEDWDYTGADATADWERQNDHITFDQGNGYLKVINSGRDATRYAWKNFKSEYTNNVIVEYTIDVGTPGANPSKFQIGSGTSSSIKPVIELAINSKAQTGTINGTAISITGASGNATGVMDITHTINMSDQTVETLIMKGSTQIYSGTNSFANANATGLKMARAEFGKINGYINLYNLKISVAETPEIVLSEETDLEGGQQEIVATVTNAGSDNSEVYVSSSDSSFDVGYDSSTGEVYVTAPSSGDVRTATITIKAVNDITVTKTVKVRYITEAYLVEEAKDTLDIAAGNDSVTKNGTAYDVVGNFTLPESPNSAQISWSATVDGQEDEDIIKIDGNEVIIGIVEGSQVVVLTATITKGSSTDTKTFTLNLPTKQEKLNAMVDALELSGDNVVKNNDGTYNVKDVFEVPLTDDEVSEVSYAWSTVDTDKLSVNGTDITPVVYGNATASLTVNAAYGDATASKTFNLVLDNSTVYYDESFDEWTTGTIVENNHNTSETKTIGDWTFVSPARTNGGNDKIVVAENTTTNKRIQFMEEFVQVYAQLLKAPTAAEIKNKMVMKLQMQLGTVNTYLIFSDGGTSRGENTLSLAASEFGFETGTLYNVELVLDNPGTSAMLLIYVDEDANGKYNTGDTLVCYEPEYATTLKSISRIEPLILRENGSATNLYMDNFYLADSVYEIDPGVIADAANISIDIPSLNKNVVEKREDGSLIAYGNFKLPTSAYGANITWTSSNEARVKVEGENATIIPLAGNSDSITLTATVEYGGETRTGTYQVKLQDPQTVVDANVPTHLSVYDYYKTKAVQIDLNDTTTPIMYDLYLPSTGDKNIKYKWSVSDPSVYTIDTNKAKIMLSDTEAKTVTFTCVITYELDSVVYATKTCTYPLTVKYDANSSEAKAAAAAGSDTALLEEYKKTLHYNYQVRFDTACAENFAGIPSVAGVSINSFDIKQTGIFGSTISWASDARSLQVLVSSSRIKVTHPSATTTANLTATVSAGTASPETKNFAISVTGTGSSNSSGGGGGGYSGSNSTTTVTGPSSTQKPTVTPAPTDPNNAFDDIDGVKSWAGDAIAKLYKNGIVSGKADRIFEPYASVTRAEFVKMLIGTLGLKSSIVTENRNFSDLPTNHWAYQYVQIAVAARIIEGYDASTFGTNDNITRQDMAVIVKRAADYAKLELPKVNEAVAFSDASSIKDYATDAVTALQQANIINGNDNGTFDPLGAANRAQAAKVLAADVFWK